MKKLLLAVTGLSLILAASPGACGGSTPATPNGGLRQPCYGNGTCNDGLTCVSDVCVDLGDAGPSSDSGSGSGSGSGANDSGSSSGSDSGAGSGGTDSGSSSGIDSGSGSGGDSGPACSGLGYIKCNGQCVDSENDANNCGACGHSCMGSTCSMYACQPEILATGLSDPMPIVVDGNNVYWGNWGGGVSGSIMQVAANGGAVITLQSSAKPGGVALDASSVYWTDMNHAVEKAPIGGGTITTVASAGLTLPIGIVVVGSTVYVTDSSSIESIPSAGGAVTTLVSGRSEPDAIVSDGSNLYWSDLNGAAGGAFVLQMPISGGAIVTLTSSAIYPGFLAVDSSSVYWSDSAAGSVIAVPIGGGAERTIASGLKNPEGIAVDATRVYWAAQDGTIVAAPKGGGSTVTLATGQNFAAGLAIDNSWVYWTTYLSASGTVAKVAK